MGRMQRYEYSSNNNQRKSRVERNSELYQDLGTVEKYTSFTDISKIEAVELQTAKQNYQTRQGYHQIKDYGIVTEKPKVQRELDEFNYLYATDENKTHDINQILEQARQIREKDALEQKRKLHNEKYNILKSSEEDLLKFKEEKNKKIKPVDDEGELEELIHTITSKELRQQIDNEQTSSLLSDLMATSVHEEVVNPINTASEEENKVVEVQPEKVEEKVEKTKLQKDIDESFYTKSMDLSAQDFDEEDDEEEKTPAFLVFLRVIFSILLIVAVGIGIYYALMNF